MVKHHKLMATKIQVCLQNNYDIFNYLVHEILQILHCVISCFNVKFIEHFEDNILTTFGS